MRQKLELPGCRPAVVFRGVVSCPSFFLDHIHGIRIDIFAAFVNQRESTGSLFNNVQHECDFDRDQRSSTLWTVVNLG